MLTTLKRRPVQAIFGNRKFPSIVFGTASAGALSNVSCSLDAIFQGRDKDPKTVPAIQSADCSERLRLTPTSRAVLPSCH